MRLLIILIAMLAVHIPLSCLADDAALQAFLKSREVLATFHFQVNASTLSAAELDRVNSILPQIKQQLTAGRMIRVEGYASPEGDRAANLSLSLYRARNLAEIIAGKGLPAEITLTGYGDLLAVKGNNSAERRVEIVAYDQPKALKKIRFADRQEILKKAAAAPVKPDLAIALVENEPMIDALAIEQAIMEKIGSGPVQPAATVTKLD